MRILVFDFDDTLFPTTYLKKNTELEKKDIKNNLKVTIELIKKAKINFDKVYIISNANLIWVQNCINEFLKDENEDVFKNIKIVCTKDNFLYEKLEVDRKKYCCFFDEFSHIFGDDEDHEFITFGDSHCDTLASENIRFLFSNVKVNIIIFKKFPSLNELLIQQNFVLENMELFKNTKENCNFILERKLFNLNI
jgi:hypothetical protein